jgi:hypothetical protein
MRFRPLMILACAAALLAAPTAAAQDPLVQGYAPSGGQEQAQIAPPVPTPAQDEDGDDGEVAGERGEGPLGGDDVPLTGAGTPASQPAGDAPTGTGGETAAGELPFTGAETAWVLGAGALLLLTGLGVRRLSAGPARG